MAKILLDTNILLDAIFFPNKLAKKAKDILEDENNTIYVSATSLIEISIKHSKHPKLMPIDSTFITNLLNENDIDILPISPNISVVLEDLMSENIHNDPFDHLLLATATLENCSLLTKDQVLGKYKNSHTIIV
ncbi:MAG: type II toxin-antitoxin system VapC family toxin [Bacilli bacterium]|nr:type II toxin-antitoxin system VapC family toxin [Bacilli bacterium]